MHRIEVRSRLALLLCLPLASCGGAAPVAPRTTAAEPVVAAEPAAPDVAATGTIAVEILPRPAYVELGRDAQLVNCDLRIDNGTSSDWRLTEIQVAVHDGTGALAWRKHLSGNGVSPSIHTIPNRDVAARQRVLLLNPLFSFPRDLELARLTFELTFERAGAKAGDADATRLVTAEVKPIVYANRARLQLPLDGRFIVWDGHDFLSHHRRWDYVFAPIRGFGFVSNAGRYSYDFIPVDAAGAMVHGDPARNESWLGFGRPLYATAAGTVVAVVDDQPDNRAFDMGKLKEDLRVVYGNYIAIDHGGNEVSLYGHLEQGSAKVALGAKVKSGQEIAAIGASGSSLMPHLHYQLQTDASGHAEGLPSYFHDFRRVLGSRAVPVERGQIDSGDLIERAGP